MRQSVQLLKSRQRLDPRYYRHRNPLSTTPLHKLKIVRIIKKHLGYHIIGTSRNLPLQKMNVTLHTRRLKMLLGISRNTNAKIGRIMKLTLTHNVIATVHLRNLMHQLSRMTMPLILRSKILFGSNRIPTQSHNILNTKITQLNQKILGLIQSKPPTQNMRDSINPITRLNCRANPHRPRPSFNNHLF